MGVLQMLLLWVFYRCCYYGCFADVVILGVFTYVVIMYVLQMLLIWVFLQMLLLWVFNELYSWYYIIKECKCVDYIETMKMLKFIVYQIQHSIFH